MARNVVTVSEELHERMKLLYKEKGISLVKQVTFGMTEYLDKEEQSQKKKRKRRGS